MSGDQAQSQHAAAGKFLTFSISKERYGVEILRVQELIGVTHITHVPRCPEFIKGVINLRGKIIPVFDLRLKFGIEPIPYDEKTCIIVVNVNKGEQKLAIGVIVDTVLEVVNLAAEEIEPAPNYGSQLDSQFIVGMGKKDGHLNILVDIQKILTESDNQQLAALGAKATTEQSVTHE
ncbi:MAG: chemotaxis protein CheW [Bdellovibrionota bacterium]